MAGTGSRRLLSPAGGLRRLLSLAAYLTPRSVITCSVIVTLFTVTNAALLCYDCDSTKNEGCGPLFRQSAFTPELCPNSSNVCALQRQDLIQERGQVAGVARTCYTPGMLRGLNSSVGCRRWTKDDGYSALYCFCDTDLCNAAPPAAHQRTLATAAQTLAAGLVALLSRCHVF